MMSWMYSKFTVHGAKYTIEITQKTPVFQIQNGSGRKYRKVEMEDIYDYTKVP